MHPDQASIDDAPEQGNHYQPPSAAETAEALKDAAPPVRSPAKIIADEYTTLSKQVPDAWGATPKEKKALIKSIHVAVLGKDKLGNLRPINDLVYFLFQSTQRNLNPFKGQIHGVYIWDSQARQEKLVVITGIGGFRAIAQRSQRPLYAGSSEPRFEEDITDDNGHTHPKSASVDIFAYNPVTGAREVITTGRAFWEEYAKYTDKYVDDLDSSGKKIWDAGSKRYKQHKEGKQLNSTWGGRPRGQLAKCAEAQGLRQAFPEELSGVYVQAEVDRLMLPPPSTTTGNKGKIKAALKAVEDTKAKPVEQQQD